MHGAVASWVSITQWLHNTHLSGLDWVRIGLRMLIFVEKYRIFSEAENTHTDVVSIRSKLGARPNLHAVID